MSKPFTRIGFVNQVRNFEAAFNSPYFGKWGSKIGFERAVTKDILQKLDLESQYEDPSNELNIVDHNTGFNSFTYELNQHLMPRMHLILPENATLQKFWTNVKNHDPKCSSMYLLDADPKSIRHFDTEALVNNGTLSLRKETEHEVNQTLLLTGSYLQASEKPKVRSMLYFNQMSLSWFKYQRVKSLFWLRPKDCIKYLGLMGTRFRQTNSVVAAAFNDINMIACSNSAKSKTVEMAMEQYKDVIRLPNVPGQEDLVLVEFQSNHDKHSIYSLPDFTLVVHKLFMIPSSTLSNNLHFLGPGADEYFHEVLPRNMLKTKVYSLAVKDLVFVANMFYRWPFKPNTDLELYLESDKS